MTRHSIVTMRRVLSCSLSLLLVAACSGRQPSRDAGDVHLRLVSYNVRHGLGMDGKLDLERVARVLEELEPDVVLLQEIDVVCGRSGAVDQARALGLRLGMDSRFAPFMDYDGGQYGLATLSRLPILDSQLVPLPAGAREPRSALVVTMRLGATSVRIANAHLDWLGDDTERRAQARALHAHLAAEESPIVLAGDLNDVPESATLAEFTTGAGPLRWIGPEAGTFPSDGPVRTIEHVLVGPSGAWEDTEVHVIDEAAASDHRPILVDLRLVNRKP